MNTLLNWRKRTEQTEFSDMLKLFTITYLDSFG